MNVNFSEDTFTDFRDALKKITRDKSLADSVEKTYVDVVKAYASSMSIFSDYFAFIGSSTFVDFLNSNRSKHGSGNFFNFIDDSIWSRGILSLSILIGVDSQTKKHKSVVEMNRCLELLGLEKVPTLNISAEEKELIKNYRDSRVAHWDYRNTDIKNVKYLLPVELLNRVRSYIVEIYYVITGGHGFHIDTVKERAVRRIRAVAELFDCNDIVKDMIKDLSDIPEERWIIPKGSGATI